MKLKLQISLLLGTLLVASSCLKPPSQTEDHGPAVPSAEVQNAIAEAWGNVDPATIRKNEFVSVEQDQKISTLDPRVVYKESTQVMDRVETADSYEYSLVLRSQILDENGSFKPVTSLQQNISVRKSADANEAQGPTSKPTFPDSLEALQKSMSRGSAGVFESSDDQVQERALGLQTVLSLYDACVRGDGWDVTCHNLRVSEGVMLPPTGVSSKPNCGDIPNCQIRFKKVSFDLVVNLTNDDGSTHTEKVIYDITISPDVPYLSRLTEFCYQGLVQASGQRILVKICNRVQNFEPGTPP